MEEILVKPRFQECGKGILGIGDHLDCTEKVNGVNSTVHLILQLCLLRFEGAHLVVVGHASIIPPYRRERKAQMYLKYQS